MCKKNAKLKGKVVRLWVGKDGREKLFLDDGPSKIKFSYNQDIKGSIFIYLVKIINSDTLLLLS